MSKDYFIDITTFLRL